VFNITDLYYNSEIIMPYKNKEVDDFIDVAGMLVEKTTQNGKINEKVLARYLLDLYNKAYDDAIKNQI